jgi:hypothetical protein
MKKDEVWVITFYVRIINNKAIEVSFKNDILVRIILEFI